MPTRLLSMLTSRNSRRTNNIAFLEAAFTVILVIDVCFSADIPPGKDGWRSCIVLGEPQVCTTKPKGICSIARFTKLIGELVIW